MIVSFLMAACQGPASDHAIKRADTTSPEADPVSERIPAARDTEAVEAPPMEGDPVYSNAAFRGVKVKRTGEHRFLVTGEARIFEATLSWVIEDGHEELSKGFETADMGAPEWGRFSFEVKAEKKRPNSTLHLILFESSAKDGSRVHELYIPLKDPVREHS